MVTVLIPSRCCFLTDLCWEGSWELGIILQHCKTGDTKGRGEQLQHPCEGEFTEDMTGVNPHTGTKAAQLQEQLLGKDSSWIHSPKG